MIKRIKLENINKGAKLYLAGLYYSEMNFCLTFKMFIRSLVIKLGFLFISLFLNFSSYSQEKRYSYKIYDNYESHDTNSMELKIIPSSDTIWQCYFDGLIVNCINEPIGFSLWTLLKDDTVIVRTGMSDSSGRFRIFCNEGCYTFKTTIVGCQNFEINLELKKSFRYQAKITLFRKTGRRSSLYISNRKPTKKMINKTREESHNCRCGN